MKREMNLLKKYSRVIKSIEKAFYAYAEQNVERVSFSQLKDWINSNIKGGISSPRLASFLRKNDQFKHLVRVRRVGSNVIETFWSLNENTVVPAESGWVEVIEES